MDLVTNQCYRPAGGDGYPAPAISADDIILWFGGFGTSLKCMVMVLRPFALLSTCLDGNAVLSRLLLCDGFLRITGDSDLVLLAGTGDTKMASSSVSPYPK